MAARKRTAAPDADSLIAKYGAITSPGTTCRTSLHPRKNLIEQLLARRVQYTRIEEIIAKEFGETERIAADNISRHHKGRCKCPKD